MQYDKFDKRIKEAADHHHPAYDEQAWSKMEKLLKKHMPQKEDDRRRFLFFILLFIGLGTAGLLITKLWKSSKTIVSTEQTVQQKQTDLPPATTRADEKTIKENDVLVFKTNDAGSTVAIDNNKSGADPTIAKDADNLYTNKRTNKNNITSTTSSFNPKANREQSMANEDNKWRQANDIKNNPTEKRTTETSTIINATTPASDVVSTEKKQNEEIIAANPKKRNTTKPAANEPTKTDDVNKERQPVKQGIAKKDKHKTKKGNSFFFILSAGPDVSFVGGDKLGTTKLITGGGLGYTFNNRFTIRAGFYAGRKVYSASPDAYHPPADFYTYYPYLENVDADCKVYELPLSISYNFSKSAKKSFFASAGVSSYLMKTEKYNYSYKYYPAGPTLNREWTIKDENKHYFSALTLSGGYQQNINKYISLMVEPYVKLPLSGVGFGKVKLNSGGVLFSIGIKPFK
jgi:hypothetical protein